MGDGNEPTGAAMTTFPQPMKTPAQLVDLWKQGRRYDGSFFEPDTLLDTGLAELFREFQAATIEAAAQVAEEMRMIIGASPTSSIGSTCREIASAIRALGETQ